MSPRVFREVVVVVAFAFALALLPPALAFAVPVSAVPARTLAPAPAPVLVPGPLKLPLQRQLLEPPEPPLLPCRRRVAEPLVVPPPPAAELRCLLVASPLLPSAGTHALRGGALREAAFTLLLAFAFDRLDWGGSVSYDWKKVEVSLT